MKNDSTHSNVTTLNYLFLLFSFCLCNLRPHKTTYKVFCFNWNVGNGSCSGCSSRMYAKLSQIVLGQGSMMNERSTHICLIYAYEPLGTFTIDNMYNDIPNAFLPVKNGQADKVPFQTPKRKTLWRTNKSMWETKTIKTTKESVSKKPILFARTKNSI